MKKKISSKISKSLNIFNYNKNNNIGKININSLKRIRSLSKDKSCKMEEIIYYDKSQKEILLSLIKNSQLNLLKQMNMIDSDNKKQEEINMFKDFLKDLKSFLTYLLNEKIRNKDYLQSNVNINKERIQTGISNNYKYDNGGKNQNIKNNSIIGKNKSIPKKNIDTEMVEKSYVGSELSKLKLQNFKTENEIIKTEFAIINMRRTLNYLKNTIIFPEDNREIYFYNNKNQEKIDKGFNYMKQKEIDKLDIIKNIVQKKKEEQEQYINAINKIKCDITARNKILENDIIYEVSLENRITSNS